MKRIVFIIIATIFACISMNAQVATSNSGLEYRDGGFYQNGIKLTTEQLCNVLGQQTYGNDYVPAKTLRTAGIVCLAGGGAVALLGSGLAIFSSSLAKSNTGAALASNTARNAGIVSGACGAALAIAGGIMLGSGNKKLKNLSAASEGAGVAVAF